VQRGPYASENIYNPKAIKENVMKNLIKIATVSSFLIITCLLIGACGSSGENVVQGKGQVAVSTTDNTTKLALPSVAVTVSRSAGGASFDNFLTDSNGKFRWVSPTGGIGSDFFFTFTKTGYATQTDIKRTPNATGTDVALDVAM
jgi:hypothetical protein